MKADRENSNLIFSLLKLVVAESNYKPIK